MEEGKMADNNDITPTAPLCLKPVDTRRATDKYFILLFPLGLVLWLGIGINEFVSDTYLQINERYNFLAKCYFQDLSIFGVITILVIFLLLFILSILRDNWVVFTVNTFVVAVAITLVALILWQLFLIVNSTTSFCLLIFLVLYFVYHVAIFVCIKECRASTLGPMIKEQCRAITRSFFATLFALAIVCLLAIILINSVAIIIVMITFLGESDQWIWWTRIVFFALGGLFVFNFIWNFGFMVMGDYFANYYGTLDTQKSANVLYSMGRVLRYHLGSVAFLATPIFPSACALVVAFKNSQQSDKQSSYKLINFVSKIWLIADISSYALIKTSIYGYKSLKSITELFDLQRKDPLLFLSLNAVPAKIVKISIILTLIIGTLVHALFGLVGYKYSLHLEYVFDSPSWRNLDQRIRMDLGFSIVSVSFITLFLVRPAACTFAICKMICRGKSTTPEEQPVLSE